MGDNACGSMMVALRHNGSTTLAILPDCTIFGCNNVLHLSLKSTVALFGVSVSACCCIVTYFLKAVHGLCDICAKHCIVIFVIL